MIPALAILWLCLLFLRPHRPWGVGEEMWLCYRREVSRYGWTVAIAFWLSIMALLGHVVIHARSYDSDLAKLRGDGNAYYGDHDIYWRLDDWNNWVMVRS